MRRWVHKFFYRAAASIPPEENFGWIFVLRKMFARDFCVFDEQGNILVSTPAAKVRHVLDLFSTTKDAQNLLKQMESLEEAKRIGSWEDSHGKKRFLYLLA